MGSADAQSELLREKERRERGRKGIAEEGHERDSLAALHYEADRQNWDERQFWTW